MKGWLREFGLCVPHIYNPVEQEVMAEQFHAPIHPGVLKNANTPNKNINATLLFFAPIFYELNSKI